MPLSEPHNISDLVGGVDTDILTKQGGVWQGSSPLGLSYDGLVLELDGDALSLINGGAISVDDAGSIEIVGTGNIEQSGTGNIEISGGGSLMVSAGGTVEISDALGKLIISSGESDAILLESGSSILIEGAGGIVLDGAGNIQLNTGQILAGAGTNLLPGLAFLGDPNTGGFNPGADIFGITAGGVLGFQVAESGAVIINTIFGDLVSSVGSGPAVRNVGATALNPPFTPNQADPDTGYTRSGVNQLSHTCGGVEALRVRSTTATVAAHSNVLIFDYDKGALNIISFGAADSGGVGFKLCRVNN